MKVWYRQRNRWFRGAAMNALTTHRSMIFSRKHGDFGMIQMPTIILGGLLSVILITSTVYYSLKPYVIYLWNLQYVDFDFWTFVTMFKFNFNILDINFMSVVIMIFTLSLGIFVFIKSHSLARERIGKQGIMPLLIFFMFYYLLMGVAWLSVAFDMVRGKVYKW